MCSFVFAVYKRNESLSESVCWSERTLRSTSYEPTYTRGNVHNVCWHDSHTDFELRCNVSHQYISTYISTLTSSLVCFIATLFRSPALRLSVWHSQILNTPYRTYEYMNIWTKWCAVHVLNRERERVYVCLVENMLPQTTTTTSTTTTTNQPVYTPRRQAASCIRAHREQELVGVRERVRVDKPRNVRWNINFMVHIENVCCRIVSTVCFVSCCSAQWNYNIFFQFGHHLSVSVYLYRSSVARKTYKRIDVALANTHSAPICFQWDGRNSWLQIDWLRSIFSYSGAETCNKTKCLRKMNHILQKLKKSDFVWISFFLCFCMYWIRRSNRLPSQLCAKLISTQHRTQLPAFFSLHSVCFYIYACFWWCKFNCVV